MAARLLRDNIFLVAAVALPLAVVGFFLAASAIPRWTVPPPRYDLLVEARTYAQPGPTTAVDFEVRGERVVVKVGPIPPNSYPGRITLFRVDHTNGHMREVSVSLPDNVKPDDPPREILVQELSGVRVLAKAEAPDGYLFDKRPRRSPGLLGDLFGMRRYDAGHVLVNRGHVVRLTPPPEHDYLSTVGLLGWILPEAR